MARKNRGSGSQQTRYDSSADAGKCYEFAATGSCSYGTACKFQHVALHPLGDLQNKNKRKPQLHRPRPRWNFSTIGESDPIMDFFARYPEFPYSEDKPMVREYYRMCDWFGWEKEDTDRIEAHDDFKTAMVLKFNRLYGTDVNDIESWHKLCVALNITPLPGDIKECRRVVRATHVNLVDLVDNTSKAAEIFRSIEDLRKYTISEGKYFPKASAYSGGVLKYLLREILI